jgi:dipeptidyl-peptidase-4
MVRARTAVVFAVALVFASVAVGGQQGETRQALIRQIDRIFKTSDFEPPRFGPARWLPDGRAYAVVERSTSDKAGATSEIVRYDAATGTRTVLVPPARLVPPGKTTALDIDDYAWSENGRRLLIFTNTRKVWRANTRGDYWVLDVDGGQLRKIGGDAPEASLMFAKFSPDATRVAYVRANDVYVERLADGAITPLTTDGSPTTINGTSDWVYEEELALRDAFAWSPDGRRIAYWQFDTTGVGMFSLINDTATLYPSITRIPYPKVGTTNAAVRIGVVSAEGGGTKWLKTPGDPRDTYLARAEWIDADTLALRQLNRLQNRLDFLQANAVTGDVRRIFSDESKAWVDLTSQTWIDGGKAFLTSSERDGWRHIYRVPREGGAPTLVTRFDADAISVAGVDEGRGFVYFLASPHNATHTMLYRSRLDGKGSPELVTPARDAGTHAYSLAPGGRMALHTYSRADRPPAMDVVTLPAHRSLRPLTDTSKFVATLAPVLTPPIEFFALDIGGGVSLDGWMLKPRSFDAALRYPVIVYVYGEPAGTTVVDGWGGHHMLFHRALADAGYLVVSFDNRGTPAPKGAAWRQVVYGAVGELSSQEQAAAVRTLASTRRYVDAGRVGVWGWSGGGSNTLNAMFRHPDVFSVGVSVAPVPDQRLYDTIYQERYMGLPQSNADGYRRGSPINFAEGLRGRLLIVHGSGDDNVHYQGTERLVDRLVALGKPFDLMVYPNRTHAIAEGEGTSAHVHQLIARYFLDHLPPGPARGSASTSSR